MALDALCLFIFLIDNHKALRRTKWSLSSALQGAKCVKYLLFTGRNAQSARVSSASLRDLSVQCWYCYGHGRCLPLVYVVCTHGAHPPHLRDPVRVSIPSWNTRHTAAESGTCSTFHWRVISHRLLYSKWLRELKLVIWSSRHFSRSWCFANLSNALTKSSTIFAVNVAWNANLVTIMYAKIAALKNWRFWVPRAAVRSATGASAPSLCPG